MSASAVKVTPFETYPYDMYYDPYEKEYGDGFYPITEKTGACSNKITIIFYIKYDCWTQYSYPTIMGLDGDEGEKLLELLNTKYNKTCNSILNKDEILLCISTKVMKKHIDQQDVVIKLN